MDKRDSVKEIKKLVNEFYGFNIAKKTRKKEYINARAAFYYLALKTGNTLDRVGRVVGKDHATVVHARKTILNHIDKPSKRKIKEDVEVLEKLLHEKIAYDGKNFSSKTVIKKQVEALKIKDAEIQELKERVKTLESITSSIDNPTLIKASALINELEGFEQKLDALCKINNIVASQNAKRRI